MQKSGSTGQLRYSWFVLALLFFVYALNFLDRQLVSILAKPIQDELGISDQQLGLINGLYFALFYCCLSVPAAWLADHTNRVRILAIACALWSAATIASGLARTYPELAASRVGVAIGEAGGVAPSYSIISDYFPSYRRGVALALFNMAPAIGMALGVAFGAKIAVAYDWRFAFVLLGIVGLVAAVAIVMLVREPAFGATDTSEKSQPASEMEDEVTFRQTLIMIMNRPMLILIAFAAGATQFVNYAILSFATLFLMREKGATLDQLAIWYALLLGICVSAGLFTAGRLVDRIAPRAPSAYGWVPGIAMVLAVPFFIGFVATPSWAVAMLFLIPPIYLNFFYLTPAVTLVQNTVPARQRSTVSAIVLLVMNLIGQGLGPTFLGTMSDWFKEDYPESSLEMAFYTLIPFYFIAIALHFSVARISRSNRA